jgi:ABC-type transport system substrate-binding protein
MKRAADSMPSGLTGLKIVSEIKQNSRRVRDLGANRGGVDLRYADLSRRGEPQPKLALSRTHSDDYKTWTYKLRPGVRFHDGTPFNAQAVKENFDRQKDPANKCRCAFYISGIHDVQRPTS